jgi:hypothetical protein
VGYVYRLPTRSTSSSYRIEGLRTFVLFIMDAAAKEWEIYRMTVRSMIPKLTEDQSEPIRL